MTVAEAYRLLSETVPGREITGYMFTKEGIVFTTKPTNTNAPVKSSYHYLVKPDKTICRTDPLTCDMDFSTFIDLNECDPITVYLINHEYEPFHIDRD